MEKHYEMLWDCQFCGTNKLLGKTHRFCPNCGAPQAADARYFPPDDEKIAVEDHQYVGADRQCPACGSLNSASAVHCGSCGAPMDGAEEARQIEGGAWMGDAQSADYADSRDVAGEQFQRELAAAGVQPDASQKPQQKRSGMNWGIAIVAIIVLAIGGFVFLFNQTQEQTVYVTGHEWTRTIQVEQYSRVRDGSWQRSVPAAAYNQRCYEKQSGTNRIPDGQDCRIERRDNGDGTFTEREVCETRYREEPVYDTWCDYDIDRWVDDDPIITSGTMRDAPVWGNTNFSCSTSRLGCQREAGRTERYLVVFTGDGETYKCPFPQPEWEAVALESTWLVEVRQFVGGAVCDTLAPY